MTSDEALMLEFQGGSRAAFDELFARYHKPLYGLFGRRLNNPERAEDLTQEAFLVVIFDRQMKIAKRLPDAVHFRCLNARGTQNALPLFNVFVEFTNRF